MFSMTKSLWTPSKTNLTANYGEGSTHFVKYRQRRLTAVSLIIEALLLIAGGVSCVIVWSQSGGDNILIRTLRMDDHNGRDLLINEAFVENLTLPGEPGFQWPQRSEPYTPSSSAYNETLRAEYYAAAECKATGATDAKCSSLLNVYNGKCLAEQGKSNWAYPKHTCIPRRANKTLASLVRYNLVNVANDEQVFLGWEAARDASRGEIVLVEFPTPMISFTDDIFSFTTTFKDLQAPLNGWIIGIGQAKFYTRPLFEKRVSRLPPEQARNYREYGKIIHQVSGTVTVGNRMIVAEVGDQVYMEVFKPRSNAFAMRKVVQFEKRLTECSYNYQVKPNTNKLPSLIADTEAYYFLKYPNFNVALAAYMQGLLAFSYLVNARSIQELGTLIAALLRLGLFYLITVQLTLSLVMNWHTILFYVFPGNQEGGSTWLTLQLALIIISDFILMGNNLMRSQGYRLSVLDASPIVLVRLSVPVISIGICIILLHSAEVQDEIQWSSQDDLCPLGAGSCTHVNVADYLVEGALVSMVVVHFFVWALKKIRLEYTPSERDLTRFEKYTFGGSLDESYGYETAEKINGTWYTVPEIVVVEGYVTNGEDLIVRLKELPFLFYYRLMPEQVLQNSEVTFTYFKDDLPWPESKLSYDYGLCNSTCSLANIGPGTRVHGKHAAKIAKSSSLSMKLFSYIGGAHAHVNYYTNNRMSNTD